MESHQSGLDRPACLVFSFPDVGGESAGEQRPAGSPAIASRVVQKRLSQSGKFAVLLGVFLFYASIGVLSAKTVVWLFGKRAADPLAETVQSDFIASSSRTDRSKVVLADGLVPDRQSTEMQDPAISEYLRKLLNRNGSQFQPSDWSEDEGNRSLATIPGATSNKSTMIGAKIR